MARLSITVAFDTRVAFKIVRIEFSKTNESIESNESIHII